jgi:small basic protein
MNMFEYVMVLASIIIGLGLTNILQGIATILQHPKRKKPYWVHLVWAAWTFLLAIFWWWWEFNLRDTLAWTFQMYLFVLSFAFIIYLTCALLFPSDLDGYDGYKEYFYARRAWFFGILVLGSVADIADSWLKGPAHFASLGPEYFIAKAVTIPLFVAAIFVRNERFQAAFAVAMLAYQVSSVFRFAFL